MKMLWPGRYHRAKKTYELDMCSGPLFSRILIFSIPLIASGILQLLFPSADIVVVGRFVGNQAMAAIGATSALTNLMINVFGGLSVGTNVIVARYYGAGNREKMEEAVHTSLVLPFIGGIFLTAAGLLFGEPLLRSMGTPADILPLSVQYVRIYFLGVPALLLYDFGSAVLRAVGDTRRPLYILFLSGILNVGLNVIFVLLFRMGVAGVAMATSISQLLAAWLVVHCLLHAEGGYRVKPKKLRIVPEQIVSILQIGLPAGLQGSVFAVSNVLIQSTVNSFGATVVAGNTASANIEGFVHISMTAFYQAVLGFTSQNYGAGNGKRMDQALGYCLLLDLAVSLGLGLGAVWLGPWLLGIYTSDPEVTAAGMYRLRFICGTYFILGTLDLAVGAMRGMGKSILPTVISLTGICGIRILWIFTVFEKYRTLNVLYLSYPVSWIITFVAQVLGYVWVRTGVRREKNF